MGRLELFSLLVKDYLHFSAPGSFDRWSHIFSQIVLNRKTFPILQIH